MSPTHGTGTFPHRLAPFDLRHTPVLRTEVLVVGAGIAGACAALHAADAQLAVAKTFDQPHPVFCLCRRELADHLGAFLAGGGRKIDRWYGTLEVVEVPFDDEEAAFRNINTRVELAEAGRSVSLDGTPAITGIQQRNPT